MSFDARHFADDWTEAWNRRDLDAILAHFGEHATFTSDRAQQVTGASTVVGKPALRAYWQASLKGITSLKFQVLDALYDPLTRTLAIRFERIIDGKTGRSIEWLRFDAEGLVVEGEGYHGPAR